MANSELQRKRKVGDDSSMKELPEKKRGRPLLLGDHAILILISVTAVLIFIK